MLSEYCWALLIRSHELLSIFKLGSLLKYESRSTIKSLFNSCFLIPDHQISIPWSHYGWVCRHWCISAWRLWRPSIPHWAKTRPFAHARIFPRKPQLACQAKLSWQLPTQSSFGQLQAFMYILMWNRICRKCSYNSPYDPFSLSWKYWLGNIYVFSSVFRWILKW